MVAGDSKKIVVIKNISSNLIEEAILILRNEPGTQVHNSVEKPDNTKHSARNDFILKEAESIINQYIRDNGLTLAQNRHQKNNRIRHLSISVNALINIIFLVASAILVFLLSRMF